MNAELMLKERIILSENIFAEIVIWFVSPPVHGSSHGFKYRLALVVNNECVWYDNEANKGDHKHIEGKEQPYAFKSIEDLLKDFWVDVDNRRV